MDKFPHIDALHRPSFAGEEAEQDAEWQASVADLSPKQRIALGVLLWAPSHRAAAKMIGVHHTTVWRWVNDADNFAKATLDALQNAGVFVDDGQVVQLEVVKVYAERDGLPRIEVAVEEIDAVELARSLL